MSNQTQEKRYQVVTSTKDTYNSITDAIDTLSETYRGINTSQLSRCFTEDTVSGIIIEIMENIENPEDFTQSELERILDKGEIKTALAEELIEVTFDPNEDLLDNIENAFSEKNLFVLIQNQMASKTMHKASLIEAYEDKLIQMPQTSKDLINSENTRPELIIAIVFRHLGFIDSTISIPAN